LGRNHRAGGRAATEEDAVEVDADNLAIHLIAHLGDGAATANTGVGHKQIEASQSRDGRLNQGINLFRVAHIADGRENAPAQGCRRVRDSLVDVGHGDRHAVLQQPPGDVQSKSSRGPGHDGNAR
jgi:hypothetical protein